MQFTAFEQAKISAQVAELVGLSEGFIKAGRVGEARDILETVDAVAPRNFAVLRLLGVVCATLGDHAAGVRYMTAALAVKDDVLAHNVLSVCRFVLGDFEDALAAADAALRLDPGFTAAHVNRGNALNSLGRSEDAVEAFRTALRGAQRDATAHVNLSNALRQLQRQDEALASLDFAIALDPGLAVAHRNRGNVLHDLGRSEEALASYARALELHPGMADAHLSRGNVLYELKRYAEAAESYTRAGQADPGLAAAQMNFHHAYMLSGDYAQAWKAFEWRFTERGGVVETRSFPAPRWTGAEPLAGKTILLHAEQGLGDAIQFARYVPAVAALGAKVVLEVFAPLAGLCRGLEGADAVVAKGEPLPPVDFHCPLMSLPLAFLHAGIAIEGAPVPYLRAEPATVARWRDRVGEGGLKVGLVASGNPMQARNAQRSLPLATLAEGLPAGPRYVLLQKELAEADRAFLAMRPDIAFVGEELTDFAETAALCEALDLVISVCTSGAHLSGALGRPTWILLSHFPCWRWELGAETEALYPSARLFRQAAEGDWPSVTAAIRQELLARL